MSQTTRLTEKGQATIPHELREKYDLEPGDELVWLDGDDGILVKKRTRMEARGMLVPDDAVEDEREEIARALEHTLREKRESEWNAGIDQ